MTIRTLLAGAGLLALGGCGGGSSSSVPVISTPSPTPSPTATPTPVATQTFVQPGLAAGGTGTTLDPGNAAAFSVVIADPDAPAAASYGAINFDGDETITVQHSTAPVAYTESFGADSFRGSGSNDFYTGSSNQRLLPTRIYQSRLGQASSAFLILPQLEEVRKTATTATATGNVTDSVRLLDVRVASSTPSQSRALQLVGSRAAASSLPVSGTRTFVGESFGIRYFADTNVQDYLGDSVLTVDWQRRTISGQITVAQFLGSTPVRPTLTVEISGTVAADGTLSGTVTVRGTNVFESGYLTGALYGATADELGLVLYTSGASGSVLGGVVAGQE